MRKWSKNGKKIEKKYQRFLSFNNKLVQIHNTVRSFLLEYFVNLFIVSIRFLKMGTGWAEMSNKSNEINFYVLISISEVYFLNWFFLKRNLSIKIIKLLRI